MKARPNRAFLSQPSLVLGLAEMPHHIRAIITISSHMTAHCCAVSVLSNPRSGPRAQWLFSHLTDEDGDAQKGLVACPRSHSQKRQGPASKQSLPEGPTCTQSMTGSTKQPPQTPSPGLAHCLATGMQIFTEGLFNTSSFSASPRGWGASGKGPGFRSGVTVGPQEGLLEAP